MSNNKIDLIESNNFFIKYKSSLESIDEKKHSFNEFLNSLEKTNSSVNFIRLKEIFNDK